MRYRIRIQGTTPVICDNGATGLDTRSAANIEKAQITKKRGSNRTVADDIRLRELECFVSLYLDEEGAATFPAAAFRTNIETAARKLRQGPQVREGLIVEEVEEFDYDRSLGTTPDELARNAQFTVGVGVGRARVLRTRARFDDWAATIPGGCGPRTGRSGTAAHLVGHWGTPSGGGELAAGEVGTVRTFQSREHTNDLIVGHGWASHGWARRRIAEQRRA